VIAPYVETVEEVQKLVGAVKNRPIKGGKLKKALSGQLRYEFKHGDLVWQIDSFVNIKMVLAEVELPSEDYEFEIPKQIEDAIVTEVTGVDGFSNESLAMFLE